MTGMTERQEEFYRLYMSGYSTGKIAKKYKINRVTAYRTIIRAEKHIAAAREIQKKFRKEEANNRNQIHDSRESCHEKEQQPDIPE